MGKKEQDVSVAVQSVAGPVTRDEETKEASWIAKEIRRSKHKTCEQETKKIRIYTVHTSQQKNGKLSNNAENNFCF